jgi:hypothetical protein
MTTKKKHDEEKPRSAVLMWTGGFDSTFLLACLAEMPVPKNRGTSKASIDDTVFEHNPCGVSSSGPLFRRDVPKYDRVRVVTIYSDILPREQQERQAMARSLALAKIEKASGRRIGCSRIDVRHDSCWPSLGDVGMIQQQMAVHHAACVAGPDEDVFVGWHRGDCAMSEIERLRRMFLDHAAALGKHGLRLLTPLVDYRKIDIVKVVHGLGLWDACTTCDDGSGGFALGTHCGTCTPCVNLLSSVVFGDDVDRETKRDILSLFKREVVLKKAEDMARLVEEAPQDVEEDISRPTLEEDQLDVDATPGPLTSTRVEALARSRELVFPDRPLCT